VPETIDLLTEPLPRNANGKVIKRQLREGLAARSAAAS
jgi:long-chain acyl-CoA synthetase